MSIIERLLEVKQQLRTSTRKINAHARAMERRREQNVNKIKEEVENTAVALIGKVGLQEIFEELRSHLSEQNFQVEVKEETYLQAEDLYYGLYSCEHQWIFRWLKSGQPKFNAFLIYITKDPMSFNLRVSGGGTGETTTDFDLSTGVENIDPERFKQAVAKAFVKPIQKTIRLN